ncbi:MAG: DUF6434 domain-containing protein [Rhodospirillales bacterium]
MYPKVAAIILPGDTAFSIPETTMTEFDWHSDQIGDDTPVTGTYRNTQNVRRFLKSRCGPDFRFDRPFMLWIKNATPKTMGDVAEEWSRRKSQGT